MTLMVILAAVAAVMMTAEVRSTRGARQWQPRRARGAARAAAAAADLKMVTAVAASAASASARAAAAAGGARVPQTQRASACAMHGGASPPAAPPGGTARLGKRFFFCFSHSPAPNLPPQTRQATALNKNATMGGMDAALEAALSHKARSARERRVSVQFSKERRSGAAKPW